jgi:hypothetical protein
LRQKEEVDLTGCLSGALKMTGRTGLVRMQAFFGVEIIDEQGCGQKNDEEKNVVLDFGYSFHLSFLHLIYEIEGKKVNRVFSTLNEQDACNLC